MPTGIIATVEDGFATIDFVDQSLRSPKLAELLAIGGPATIETITRDGPRRKYRVPVGNAAEAGLLDLDEDDNPTEGPATFSAGADTGAAAALVAADPNVNPGADNANWHTPVAEHTSANKYVGQVANSAVLHNRGQVFTGTASSYGGSGETPLHTEVIEYVKGGTIQAEQRVASFGHPAAEANLMLGTMDSALGTDPGATPDVGGSYVAEDYTSVQASRDEPLAGAEDVIGLDGNGDPETPPPAPSEPAEPVTAPGPEVPGDPGTQQEPEPTTLEAPKYPEGEPDDSWKRPELDAYALDKHNLDTTDLPNKAAVLNAITNAKENQ